jgi:hypothetical protein
MRVLLVLSVIEMFRIVHYIKGLNKLFSAI